MLLKKSAASRRRAKSFFNKIDPKKTSAGFKAPPCSTLRLRYNVLFSAGSAGAGHPCAALIRKALVDGRQGQASGGDHSGEHLFRTTWSCQPICARAWARDSGRRRLLPDRLARSESVD